MRHAKSSWADPALTDFERPLNKRGKRDSPRMAEHLKALDLEPDAIYSSSSQRTQQTVAGLVEVWGEPEKVEFLRELYHGGGEEFLEVLASAPSSCERVMLVGHNPGCEYFVQDLGGDYERMPTAAVAHFTLEIESWSEVSGDFEAQLKGLWRPKEI